MCPANARWYTRRKINESIGCIKNAQEHIVAVAQPFETVHPEYYQAFSAVVQALETIIPTIEAIRDKI